MEMDDSTRRLLESMSNSVGGRQQFPLAVIIGGILLVILLLVLVLVVVCIVLKAARRRQNDLWRIVFRLANDRDSSPRTINSPTKRGRFEPPVWCNVCNEHIDHVDKMCPHIGQKLYKSSMNRQLYRKWHQQLIRRHRSIGRFFSRSSLPRPLANRFATESNNVTIDLNELLHQGQLEHRPSIVSFESIGSIPRPTSTPDGKSRRMARQRSTLSNIRSWMIRRRRSTGSSGIGDSFGSDEDIEAGGRSNQQQLMAKVRRWASSLANGGARADVRPIPKIIIEPPTPKKDHRPMGDQFLNIKMMGIRRAFSEPSDNYEHQPRRTPMRTFST